MAERLELYKCKICGQVTQVILSGVGIIVITNRHREKVS